MKNCKSSNGNRSLPKSNWGALAVTVELTGLFNRRQFTQTLNLQIETAQKAAEPFGLLLIDLKKAMTVMVILPATIF